MKIKTDLTFVSSLIENRKLKFNCEILDKSIQEIQGSSLKFVGYTWDEKHPNINKEEMQYLVYFVKNDRRMHYNRYTSAMERDERLFNLLSTAEDLINKIKKDKEKEKKQKEEMIKTVSIGDIFVSSWGYDQTNVNAYQVIEKKLKTVVLSEIRLAQVGGTEAYMSCQVTPIKDAFIDKNKTIKKLIKPNGIKISSYAYAYKWDGKSTYYNSWYA